MSVLSIEDYDSWDNNLYGYPCGLYFYYLNPNQSNYDEARKIIGNCSAIQSVSIAPYIGWDDVGCTQVTYDGYRFGTSENGGGGGGIRGETYICPQILRISSILQSRRTVGQIKCFTTDDRNTGKGCEWRWQNEGKLYGEPYFVGYLVDGITTPVKVNYNLCPADVCNVMTISTISDRCTYGIYIQNYNNDYYGRMEAQMSTGSLDLPCSSNAYAQWISQNKNQINASIQNATATTLLQNQGISQQSAYAQQLNSISQNQNQYNGITNAVGGLASMLQGNLAGGLTQMFSSGTNALFNNQTLAIQNQASIVNASNQQALNNQSVENLKNSAIATSEDMKNVPNSMISMGSDVYYGLAHALADDASGYVMRHYKYGITERYLQRIGNYFHMYGYKMNYEDTPDTRSRHYFNYIKTIGANVQGNIPRNYIEKIKAILDKGTTIWHVDRCDDDNPVMSYKMDNYEEDVY